MSNRMFSFLSITMTLLGHGVLGHAGPQEENIPRANSVATRKTAFQNQQRWMVQKKCMKSICQRTPRIVKLVIVFPESALQNNPSQKLLQKKHVCLQRSVGISGLWTLIGGIFGSVHHGRLRLSESNPRSHGRVAPQNENWPVTDMFKKSWTGTNKIIPLQPAAFFHKRKYRYSWHYLVMVHPFQSWLPLYCHWLIFFLSSRRWHPQGGNPTPDWKTVSFYVRLGVLVAIATFYVSSFHGPP